MQDKLNKLGVHAIVDGQFGSTGKGLFASYLAEVALENNLAFAATISNAGPNSGHTFYVDNEKHVLKQLPSFAVAQSLMGAYTPTILLSAGAIIDPEILIAEAEKYNVDILVHPNAAVITDHDKETEHGGSIAAVAGTRSGTGAALARKVFRDPKAIAGNVLKDYPIPSNVRIERTEFFIFPDKYRYMMEVSQGFSLGINSQFYPKVTSRECTVMQGIADARVSPKYVADTYMVIRSFPIRVGNVDGHSSGDMYYDQQELNWSDIGVDAELTTVTQRERRVFSFSVSQVFEAVKANTPSAVLVNFMNYLDSKRQEHLIKMVSEIRALTRVKFDILTGFGPHNKDIVPW